MGPGGEDQLHRLLAESGLRSVSVMGRSVIHRVKGDGEHVRVGLGDSEKAVRLVPPVANLCYRRYERSHGDVRRDSARRADPGQ